MLIENLKPSYVIMYGFVVHIFMLIVVDFTVLDVPSTTSSDCTMEDSRQRVSMPTSINEPKSTNVVENQVLRCPSSLIIYVTITLCFNMIHHIISQLLSYTCFIILTCNRIC